MAEATRRTFLSRVGWTALGAAIGGAGYGSISYLLSGDGPGAGSQFLPAGRVSDYAVGDQKMIEAEPYVYLFRTASGFQAISARCTYEGCTIKPFGAADSNAEMLHTVCPCCGSTFARTGDVLAGPATRPLPFFGMALRGGQELLIDLLTTTTADLYVLMAGRGISNRLYFNPLTGEMKQV